MSDKLLINEIFRSFQGEGSRTGLPCVLVRLTGCNLRCDWCDTQYAWLEGERMSIDEVLTRVAGLKCPRVEVTGGEPLAQPGAFELLSRLCDAGYETLLETNGSLDISQVDKRVVRIVDFKCPSSGHTEANLWENVQHLTDRDEVKFVIADEQDYVFAREAVREHKLTDKCLVTFSPVADRLTASMLAELLLSDDLDVRLGVQLHKIIWPDYDRGK